MVCFLRVSGESAWFLLFFFSFHAASFRVSKDHSNKRQLELQPAKTRTKPDFEYLSFSAVMYPHWVEMWSCCKGWVLPEFCITPPYKNTYRVSELHISGWQIPYFSISRAVFFIVRSSWSTEGFHRQLHAVRKTCLSLRRDKQVIKHSPHMRLCKPRL